MRFPVAWKLGVGLRGLASTVAKIFPLPRGDVTGILACCILGESFIIIIHCDALITELLNFLGVQTTSIVSNRRIRIFCGLSKFSVLIASTANLSSTNLLLVFKDVSRIGTCGSALEAVAVNEEFLALEVVMYDFVESRLPSSACSAATKLPMRQFVSLNFAW